MPRLQTPGYRCIFMIQEATSVGGGKTPPTSPWWEGPRRQDLVISDVSTVAWKVVRKGEIVWQLTGSGAPKLGGGVDFNINLRIW